MMVPANQRIVNHRRQLRHRACHREDGGPTRRRGALSPPWILKGWNGPKQRSARGPKRIRSTTATNRSSKAFFDKLGEFDHLTGP